MASAWGPHLQQVVGVPVGLSCDSDGGQKGRDVGGGSIHKLPRALPGRNVALSALGARRSTAGTVEPGTYSTCSSCLWWAWFPRGGPGGSGRLCMFQNRLYASRPHRSVGGARFGWPQCACGSPGVICWVTPGVVGMGRGVCPPVGGLASGLG